MVVPTPVDTVPGNIFAGQQTIRQQEFFAQAHVGEQAQLIAFADMTFNVSADNLHLITIR